MMCYRWEDESASMWDLPYASIALGTLDAVLIRWQPVTQKTSKGSTHSKFAINDKTTYK